MTLKATRIRLILQVVTTTAMLAALVLAGAIGPLTGFMSGAVAWAAPNVQDPPPSVSFTNSELEAQEGRNGIPATKPEFTGKLGLGRRLHGHLAGGTIRNREWRRTICRQHDRRHLRHRGAER